jgi:hypothetical protein
VSRARVSRARQARTAARAGLAPRAPGGAVAVIVAVALLAAGCGASAGRAPAKPRRAGAGIPASLLAGLRTVGRGRRFRPAVSGPVLGRCTPTLGRRIAAHLELFGDNHVVLIAAGVGTRPPRTLIDERLVRARCFGAIVTLDPTGVVYARAGERLTVGQLFRSWGEPLTTTRLASFTGGPVRVYIDGRRSPVPAARVDLTEHAEIVLEVGPQVPPHRSFTFAPAPPASLR